MQTCRERMHRVVAARAPDHVRPIAGKGVQEFQPALNKRGNTPLQPPRQFSWQPLGSCVATAAVQTRCSLPIGATWHG